MRIAFLCGADLNAFQARVVAPFLASSRHEVRGVVIDARKPAGPRKKLQKNLKRGRGGYVLVMAFKTAFARKERGTPTKALFEERGIPVIETARVHSEETLNRIKALEADVLLLVGGFGIIRKSLLELAEHGVLSYHHGDMREYRGQPPGLWELYNGDSRMGITVQRLAEGLDCGEPILEKALPIEYGETPGRLRSRAEAESTSMMFDAVCRLEDPGFRPRRIDSFGTVYTLPNLRQWLHLQFKILFRKTRILLGHAREQSPRVH